MEVGRDVGEAEGVVEALGAVHEVEGVEADGGVAEIAGLLEGGEGEGFANAEAAKGGPDVEGAEFGKAGGEGAEGDATGGLPIALGD